MGIAISTLVGKFPTLHLVLGNHLKGKVMGYSRLEKDRWSFPPYAQVNRFIPSWNLFLLNVDICKVLLMLK